MQELLQEAGGGTDASGNPILADIGKFLAGYIKNHFKEAGDNVDLKYIDPTYMVRAIPTIPSDHIYCKVLGQNAVHAAFSGYTGMCQLSSTECRQWYDVPVVITVPPFAGCLPGLLNTHHVLLPIPTVISRTRAINISGRKWNRLKTSIRQPDLSP